SKSLTVRVGGGSNQEEFIVHEGFVCGRSEFFRRALNGNWRASEDRIVELPHRKPEIFALWLNHAYTNQIPTKDDTELRGITKDKFDIIVQKEYRDLCELYVLCEELVDSQAQRAIIDAMFAVAHIRHGHHWRVPSAQNIRLIYEGTPEQSPIRKLMVDLWSD
ncbi:hypothetical protein K491DRAFT_570699, partial [Lophiostoma macrostomum CBS 122681]